MIDEGYIKFHSGWTQGPPPSHPGLLSLIDVRNQLFEKELIGIYEDSGIGYGNVSIKSGFEGDFIISGTRTGGIETLGPEHFCLVTGADISNNSVKCRGPVEASSESMTHAMFYNCSQLVGSVLHVHHYGMWKWMHNRAPLSDPKVPYGTPAMAEEVDRLFRESDLETMKIMAMGGHEEGIIAFGNRPQDAARVIFDWFDAWAGIH